MTKRIDVYALVKQLQSGSFEEWTMSEQHLDDPASDLVLVEIEDVPDKHSWVVGSLVERPVRITWQDVTYRVRAVVRVLSDREKDGFQKALRYRNYHSGYRHTRRYGYQLEYPEQDLILRVDTRDKL